MTRVLESQHNAVSSQTRHQRVSKLSVKVGRDFLTTQRSLPEWTFCVVSLSVEMFRKGRAEVSIMETGEGQIPSYRLTRAPGHSYGQLPGSPPVSSRSRARPSEGAVRLGPLSAGARSGDTVPSTSGTIQVPGHTLSSEGHTRVKRIVTSSLKPMTQGHLILHMIRKAPSSLRGVPSHCDSHTCTVTAPSISLAGIPLRGVYLLRSLKHPTKL